MSGQRKRGRQAGASIVLIGLLISALGVFGCGSSGPDSTTVAATTSNAAEGTAVLHELNGSGVSGTALYSENAYHVPIKIELEGLERATGENQYVLWEVPAESGKRELGSYHVPSGGKLTIELVSTYLYSLEEARETELLVTKVKSDDYLRERAAESPYDESYVGARVARGGLK